jgi:hypothetical protein
MFESYSNKVINRYCLLFAIFLIGINVCAQEQFNSRPLYTDRPGQSINPNTVGDGVLQLQSGYGYFKSKGIFSEIDLHNVDLVPKLGISDRFEISGLLQYSSLKLTGLPFVQPSEESPDPENGVSALGLAARGTLLKGEGLIPSIGLEAAYIGSGIPGDELSTSTGRFILTLQNQLLGELSFTGNVVYNTNNQTEFTANLGYNVVDNFGCFVEYWPIFDAAFDGEDNLVFQDAYLNSGVFWLIGENWQLDALAGFRAFAPDFYSDDESSYYLQVGFTKRFWLKE